LSSANFSCSGWHLLSPLLDAASCDGILFNTWEHKLLALQTILSYDVSNGKQCWTKLE